MTTHHTDLGNEVRAEIARILARYQDCDLAGVKMSTIRKIDRLINQGPEGFDVVAWMSAPSRANPTASAFAVNARKQ